jgi:predicted acylesterase/phospholipase RssA
MDTKQPRKNCDLVMKGGVTSGVVYPKAITELSEEYRFVSIGGTSAGAIAAAVAAAAEYARAGGRPDAFEEVDKLPEWLGGTSPDGKHSNLFHLFQPQRAFRGLYTTAMGAMGKSGAKKWLAIIWTALREFPIVALFGILPGLLIAWLALEVSTAWLRWAGFLLAVLIGVVGLLLGFILVAGAQIASIPKFAWGVCSGMTEGDSGKSPALVPWLAGYLDSLAGKKEGEPLTFGDLEERDINLRMITTNLTNGRPYSMPFVEHTHFYFKGAELRRFFPEYVVNWMEKNPGTRSTRDQNDQVERGGLSVLPDAQKLPVIVAVRMSLSFPFLFCPIPLYGVDFGFGPKTPDGQKHIPEPSFFVDGGLADNFPLNLFDKPLPRWPTFGINLRSKNDGRHNRDVYIPCKNSGGLEEWWTRFDQEQGLGGLLSYFSLLFDTSRNWRDNLQIGVPGYRDRVVHIGLDPEKEGGLNLDMGDQVIALLTQRGQKAGGAILSRYSPTVEYPRDPDCVVDLENQKWIRFRSFMELFEQVVLSMDGAIKYSGFGEPTYDDLLDKAQEPSYAMSNTQRQYAINLLGALMRLAPDIRTNCDKEQSFETKAPRPEPDLKVTPHV